MHKQYFIRLLRKYLNNQANEEEERFLFRYYELFEKEKAVLDLLDEDARLKLKDQIQNEVWKNIARTEGATAKVRSMRMLAVKITAAAVVVLLLTGMLLYFRPYDASEPVVASLTNHLKEYQIIRLQDHSTVVLGSHSKLDYPATFDGLKTREVYLEGQAFFDIQKDSSKPFIVHTGKLQTRVLGTAFNIKAFSVEDEITVTVKRGRVQVNNEDKTLGIITPEQQIVYNKNEDKSEQKTVNSDDYLEWKVRDLVFDNLTFAQAAKLLEDRFNVAISIIDSSVSSKTFSTTLPGNQSLDVTLKGICEFNGASYQYDKDKSRIIIKAIKK